MQDHGLTPAVCRAARAAVNVSQERLAELARVSRPTVQDFERGVRVPIGNNLAAIRAALEASGVVFHPLGTGNATVTFPDADAEGASREPASPGQAA